MTKFHTILIDPPWNEQGGGKIKRGADRHYKLMKVEKILETIRRSGKFTPDENCHLYLWVTNNYLPDGIWLIEQLGFKYITCITWVKPSYGLGRYFRGQRVLDGGLTNNTPLFQDDFQSICGPKADEGELLFLTAVLASPLAQYLLFHTTANIGIERDSDCLRSTFRIGIVIILVLIPQTAGRHQII